MPHRPQESLENLRERVGKLETPRLTSPTYSRFGWPMVAIGAILWFIDTLLEGVQIAVGLGAIVFLAIGGYAVATSIFSAHSENVEKEERDRRIRERSKIMRCIYLEGNVPDGKGMVGQCKLYDFDMVDLPCCLYCKEYSPTKGSPKV